jgi:hypothetical protein
LRDSGGPAVRLREWSTDATFETLLPIEGVFTYEVWGRSAGVTVDMAQVLAYLVVSAHPPPQSSPLTGLHVSSDVPSPRPAQQAVTFSAGPAGGIQPIQLKWLVNGSMVQDWTASTTYRWTPATAGLYSISVWARRPGATADVAEVSATFSFTITTPTAPQMTGIRFGTFTETRTAAGVTVFLAWSGEGGTPPYEFLVQFRPEAGVYQTVRDWSSAPNIDRTISIAGNYQFLVSGRSAGSASGAVERSGSFSLHLHEPMIAAPPTSVTLVADKPSPQPRGSLIRLTATATGSAQYFFRYEFQLDSGTPLVLPDWGFPGTYAWTPSAAGTYKVTAFARQRDAGQSAPQLSTTITFVISP